MDRALEREGTLVTCINSPTPGKRRAGHSSVDRAREGGTLVTCINSPTPVQEKSKAQFRGPGERGRNSSYLYKFPDTSPARESRAQFRGPGERGRNSSYLYKFPDTRAREEQGTVPWTGREREEL